MSDEPGPADRSPRPPEDVPTEVPRPPDEVATGSAPAAPDPGPPAAADSAVDDDDRAHVMALLEQAVGRGLVDTPEFDRRAGVAVTARTRRELNGLVVDLPLEHPDRARARTAAESRPERPRTGPGASPSGHDAVDTSGTVALRTTLGSVKRSGPWAVPRRLEIEGWLGSAELDLTAAVVDHDVVEIDVDLVLGSVELRLPDSAGVSLEGVSATAGSIEDKRRSGAARGRPHVVVTGQVTLGSVEIKGPRRGWLG